MFLLFEETGKFLAGRILSESDASLQVELDSGKRVKVKAVNALLRFEKPSPAEFVANAMKLTEEIELDLAWEFASEEEFSFADLAREYFSSDASKPTCCFASTTRRTTFAALAGDAFGRRRPKFCSRRWLPSKRKNWSLHK